MSEDRILILKRATVGSLVITAAGLILLLTGLATSEGLTRVSASLLVGSTFIIGVAVSGAFFIASHAIGQAGWHIGFARVLESMALFVPAGGILLLVALSDFSHLYHWAHEPVHGKESWLNPGFFFLRTILYLVLWTLFAIWFNRLFNRLENTGDLKYYHRLSVASALFLVVFAITEALAAFDWIMSTDPHWYSTLFGWYVFSSYWVSAIALIALLLLFFRSKGLYTELRDAHIHDIGKYVFGFSIFWAYLFYSQYMLQWYGNIPEETHYYVLRVYDNSPWFYILPVINFAVPLFLLMRNSAKTSTFWLGLTSVLVLIGHWLDFWLMIYPSVFGANSPIGLCEIGGLLLVTGLLLSFIFWRLSRLPSISLTRHPFFRESLTYKS